MMIARILAVFVFFTLVIALVSCNGKSTNSTKVDSQEMTTQQDEPSMEDVLSKMKKDNNVEVEERLTYTVSLGVNPDMSYEGEGMLIGQLREGKPAHKAGLMKGDIVVEMGGEKITDLVAYTKKLGTYQAGDEAKVVVKRGDELLTVLVEF